MSGPFRYFVIFASMRTGSNLLEETLGSVDGITMHGEAFNPAFLAWPDRDRHLDMTRTERDADPAEFLGRIRAAPGMNGFRYFPGHDQRVLDLILADPGCAKIILTRNPAESYVSLQIARQTGQWKLTDGRRRKAAKVTFDEAGFAEHLAELGAFHQGLRHGLQATGQTAFHLRYDELTDPAVLGGLVRFLGLPATKVKPARTILPQNPGMLTDKVVNPAQMAAALARSDPYGLSHLPDFEPRRGPAVPGFVASCGAPLLFLPVRMGPTDSVTRWLASLGGAGARGDFTRASLRDWMAENQPHRRFTVLRHPVARAHAAFRAIFVDGIFPGLQDQLGRSHKIRLAPDAIADLSAQRAAFVGFLDFLRANLKGQTARRVEPIWASQAASLQGYAEFAIPDVVIRESDLARGLARLCEDIGLTAPPPPIAEDPVGLAALYDSEVEELVREAYPRDYLLFGFGAYG
jgi:LPS sulfotransferase NodH